MSLELFLSTEKGVVMSGNHKEEQLNDEQALVLISHHLENEGKKTRISSNLLMDANFYPLVQSFEFISKKTLKKDLREYINLGFIDTCAQTGANSDPAYRRMILRLCIEFFVSYE